MNEPLLTVRDLHVHFSVPGGRVEAVRGVSFEIRKGETLALVGESGSGKSVTALSILQLLPYPMAEHPSGSIRFKDHELVDANERTLRAVRGNQISMIFQEPMTSLNPLHTVEKQIREVLVLHKGLAPAAAHARLEKALANSLKLRNNGKVTLPSSIAREREINLFLRTDEQALRAAVERETATVLASPTGVFAALRRWKDRFQGA